MLSKILKARKAKKAPVEKRPRADSRENEPAQTEPKARRAVVFVAMGLFAVFLGALAGAHLALSAKESPAHISLSAIAPPAETKALTAPVAAPPTQPLITAAPAMPRAEPKAHSDEAALARLYEEAPEPPLEAAAKSQILAPEAVPAPAGVQSPPAAMEAFVPGRRPPRWLRNAVHTEAAPGQPMIAIVIDDLGLRRAAAYRAIALPGPLTLAFMTYAKGLPAMAGAARQAGHELLLHVPMEPKDARYDPGPKVLKVGMPQDEINARLSWGLARFDGFVGINNHMGSRFTAAPEGMAVVMRALRERDLLFLDSMTSGSSVAWKAAARSGVPFARRDIFLDHADRTPDAIRGQLDALEHVARQRGYAVGIGHPHTATLEVLAAWLPEARKRGFALVPISAIVGHQIEVAQGRPGSAG
jgi:polysaccharide deacetylase 2 family uncharacterized protein YibQ